MAHLEKKGVDEKSTEEGIINKIQCHNNKNKFASCKLIFLIPNFEDIAYQAFTPVAGRRISAK